MDWSPILISMKTASLSIFITFFIGLFAAWAVVSLKNETLKVICDGILTLPLVLPPTVAGFLAEPENPVFQISIDFALSFYRKRTNGFNVQARDP